MSRRIGRQRTTEDIRREYGITDHPLTLLQKITESKKKNVVDIVKDELVVKDGLNGLDGVDGKDGGNGKDGVDGKDGINGRDGVDGKNGIDGKNGVDGKNGIDGKDGVDGKNGIDGKDGVDGRDGVDGKNGIDGRDGVDGFNGKDGQDGVDGKDGENGISIVRIEDNYERIILVLSDVSFNNNSNVALSPNGWKIVSQKHLTYETISNFIRGFQTKTYALYSIDLIFNSNETYTTSSETYMQFSGFNIVKNKTQSYSNHGQSGKLLLGTITSHTTFHANSCIFFEQEPESCINLRYMFMKLTTSSLKETSNGEIFLCVRRIE